MDIDMDDNPLDFNHIEVMKACIRKVIMDFGEPSFMEMCTIPNFVGDQDYVIPECNLLVWPQISSIGFQAIHELLGDGEIDMFYAHPAVYRHVGCDAGLPIAKGLFRHDTLHWLPMKFRNKGIKTFN